MRVSKYHGLGNEYLVTQAKDVPGRIYKQWVPILCHRNFGVGSDGLLIDESEDGAEIFSLRIINPDGSEAEKSGNGLRIFSRYLYDLKRVNEGAPFKIQTAGGLVSAQVHKGGSEVEVEMGKVSFDSSQIPVAGPVREVLKEPVTVGGKTFNFSAATVGNPHCVIIKDDISEAEARQYGPLLEVEERFPNRTNVQFAKILDKHHLQLEIWERGAGYTLASGSSSAAAVGVAVRLGLCSSPVTVVMPGGELTIAISEEWEVTMIGPVVKVCDAVVDTEMFTVRLP